MSSSEIFKELNLEIIDVKSAHSKVKKNVGIPSCLTIANMQKHFTMNCWTVCLKLLFNQAVSESEAMFSNTIFILLVNCAFCIMVCL